MRQDIIALLTRPALELAALVRQGDVTARELAEAALSQIEARQDLNAFTFVTADSALAAASAIGPGDPRPFAGVPIAIKELNPMEGQPLTMGSDIFGDFRSDHDAYVVRRLKDAGFVIVGRTSAPEFGILPVTEPRRFGPTRNPWDLSRTPGGSSGGAAAAVAGGILPVAHGSDGAGSIRIPSACCGLVGLKASRGRVSRGPDLGDDFSSTDGVLTRTIADTAALLDVLAGYEQGDATWAPPPAAPFATLAAQTPRRLRIAFTTASPLDTPVDPICAQAARDAAALLSSLGHEVEEVTPPGWQVSDLLPQFLVLYSAVIATGVRYGAIVTGRDPAPDLVEAMTWAFYEMGTTASAADFHGAQILLEAHARAQSSFFATYDVLVTPTLAQRPLPVGAIDTGSSEALVEFQKAAEFAPFTAGWNISGQPAISLPLLQGDDDLPTGVQLVGPPLGEGLLLSLGAQIEMARPWASRRPAGVG
jgi:amidase